jgi:hypothetical protein
LVSHSELPAFPPQVSLRLDGTADLSLELELLFFNPALGEWEPIVEPWSFDSAWSLTDDAAANEQLHAARDAAAQQSTYQLKVSSGDGAPLEVNVSHALLCSLVTSSLLLERATTALTAAEPPFPSTPSLASDPARTCAVLNLTEVPLTVTPARPAASPPPPGGAGVGSSASLLTRSLDGSSRSLWSFTTGSSGDLSPSDEARLVMPGSTVAFFGSRTADGLGARGEVEVGRRAHEEARTANCEELVRAAAKGNVRLLKDLLGHSASASAARAAASPPRGLLCSCFCVG